MDWYFFFNYVMFCVCSLLWGMYLGLHAGRGNIDVGLAVFITLLPIFAVFVYWVYF